MERLDAYLDGELAGLDLESFLCHARDCSACQEELASAEAIRSALSHINDNLSVPLQAQASWRSAIKREAKRHRGRAIYRAVSAIAAAFVLLAGTTAIFRSTGVLDFDVQTTSTADVHIITSAPKPQYYKARSETQDASEEPRHAQVEADGATNDATAPIALAMQAESGEEEAAVSGDGSSGDSISATSETASEGVSDEADNERLLARSATREMYTESVENAHTSIVALVEEYNGNVVSDSRSGEKGSQSVTMAVDVPTSELDDFLAALDFVAEVTYQSSSNEDISTNYYDAQGRLETLEMEKDRLNELIASANAEELQELDAQLDEIYEQIDVLESKLRSFDSQLTYARVDIVLREGAQLTATAITGDGSSSGAAKQGLARSLDAIGSFFSDMGVSLAVIAPYAGIAVLLIALVWLGVALTNRHRRHD